MTEAIETREIRGFTANLHYEECAENPLSLWDHAWELIGGQGCDYTLDDNNRRASFDDYDGVKWIQHYRTAGDTVALLRVSDYGSQGGSIRRVDDLRDCNAIAVISAAVIAEEWPDGRVGAYKYLDGILTEVNSYLRGECYLWEVTGPDGDYVDGCGGYYGETDRPMGEAVSTAERAADERDRENLMRGLAQVGAAA